MIWALVECLVPNAKISVLASGVVFCLAADVTVVANIPCVTFSWIYHSIFITRHTKLLGPEERMGMLCNVREFIFGTRGTGSSVWRLDDTSHLNEFYVTGLQITGAKDSVVHINVIICSGIPKIRINFYTRPQILFNLFEIWKGRN